MPEVPFTGQRCEAAEHLCDRWPHDDDDNNDVDDGYHIDYAEVFTIPNALYEVVKKFARQRLDRTVDGPFF